MDIKKLIGFFLAAASLSGKYRFDEQDMQVLNTYNIGDTLVFQSNAASYDSIVIVDKQLHYNGRSEGYSGNPQTCRITYQTIPISKPKLVSFGGPQGDIYSSERCLLSAVKQQKRRPAVIKIEYGGFGGNISTEQNVVSNEEYGEHYDITHFCIDCVGVDSTDVVRVKWKPGRGIIWYQRRDSSVYRLVRRY